jgi:hypothetical protein
MSKRIEKISKTKKEKLVKKNAKKRKSKRHRFPF